MSGYKQLISYKLTLIIFDLTWDFVPRYYRKYEDARQRSQMKQASRSQKQNIVEGSEERSISTKLKLYDVARASGGELLEDFQDIFRREGLPLWSKEDPRLKKLREVFEKSSDPPVPSCSSVLRAIRGNRWNRGTRKENIDIVVNYTIDLLKRSNFLMDKQINAVEKKHEQEGGYTEKLYQKRKSYRGY